MKNGKKYRQALEKYNPEERYGLEQALELVKSLAYAKFDETVEIALKLNVKSKHSIRDTLVLPNSFWAEKKILVFAKGEKAQEAKDAGATYVGDDDLVEKIKEGWLDFDVAVATPDMMKEVSKLGKILGPRGLMPNPKAGTVTFDIAKAISEIKSGKIEFRVDKTAIIHSVIGKVSFEDQKLLENARVLAAAIIKGKPAASKGRFIRSIHLSSTMSPSFKINPTSIESQ